MFGKRIESEKNMPQEMERRMRPKPPCFTIGPWEGPHFSMFSDQKPRTLAAFVADICPLFHILAKETVVLQKPGCLEWGMSWFSPLPLLLPKQLTTSSDVVLWLYSKQHCSCGHGILSVSESESC